MVNRFFSSSPPKGPSFSQRLNEGIGGAAQAAGQFYEQRQQQEQMQQQQQQLQQQGRQASELAGMDISKLSPDMQKVVLQDSLQGKRESAKYKSESQAKADKLSGENKEKLAPFQGALQTIDDMEKIIGTGNLGIGSSAWGVIYPETRQSRAEYSRLGKSLISMASTIPIRNQVEFEKLAEGLDDPSQSEASMRGMLSAMKKIIQRSMSAYEQGDESESASGQQQNALQQAKQRPPLSSFKR